MSFEAAVRATEVLMALAFLQQSAEHLVGPTVERWVFTTRMAFALLLITGVPPEMGLVHLQRGAGLIGLAAISLWMLYRYQGPYNGGSDRMSLIVLWCLLGVYLAPPGLWEEALFGYLAVQVALSYFMSGQVKLVNPDWRSGRALCDVFEFSAYPVSGELRGLAARPTLLWSASWAVILFEALFPLALLTQASLLAALAIAALFHLANACLFGLNRFLWIWLAAYPSLIWLQGRLL